jgi:hypothetical protein
MGELSAVARGIDGRLRSVNGFAADPRQNTPRFGRIPVLVYSRITDIRRP